MSVAPGAASQAPPTSPCRSRADGFSSAAAVGLTLGLALYLIGLPYHGQVLWPGLYLSYPLAYGVLLRRGQSGRYTLPYMAICGLAVFLVTELSDTIVTHLMT